MRFANYMSFSADVNQHGLEYAAKHSASLGFDAVEFLVESPKDEPFSDITGAEAAKRVLDAHGLSVACYSVGYNLAEQDTSGLLRHAELAAAVGSPMIHHTLFPLLSLSPDSPKYEEIFDSVLVSAIQVAKHCKVLGLTCLYEPQGMYFNGTDGLGRFFDAMLCECDNIGICGDTATSLFVDVNPTEIFTQFSRHIRHIHAHNYGISNTETDYRSRGGKYLYDADLTEGVVDVKACFEQLKDYQGIISLEMVTDDETLKNTMDHIRTFF